MPGVLGARFFVLLLGDLLRFFHLLFFLSEDLTLLNG